MSAGRLTAQTTQKKPSGYIIMLGGRFCGTFFKPTYQVQAVTKSIIPRNLTGILIKQGFLSEKSTLSTNLGSAKLSTMCQWWPHHVICSNPRCGSGFAPGEYRKYDEYAEINKCHKAIRDGRVCEDLGRSDDRQIWDRTPPFREFVPCSFCRDHLKFESEKSSTVGARAPTPESKFGIPVLSPRPRSPEVAKQYQSLCGRSDFENEGHGRSPIDRVCPLPI